MSFLKALLNENVFLKTHCVVLGFGAVVVYDVVVVDDAVVVAAVDDDVAVVEGDAVVVACNFRIYT